MPHFLSLLAAVILSACAAANAPASAPLAGTTWTLQTLARVPIGKTPRPPTLRFLSQTEVGGHGGCNSWGGSYELNGATIKFGQMHTTLMACEHGMDVESRFHEALKQSRRLTISGDTLALTDGAGMELAMFERAP